MTAVKERYKANLEDKTHSLLYIRQVTDRGVELAGHIDLADRIKTENFNPYLTGEKRLMPRMGDVTFCNFTRSGLRKYQRRIHNL